MKAGIRILFIAALAAAACGWWITCGRQEGQLQAAWRDARFRDPQATLEEVSEALHTNRRLRESRPAGFGAEIGDAVQAEFDVWQRQFEKGEIVAKLGTSKTVEFWLSLQLVRVQKSQFNSDFKQKSPIRQPQVICTQLT